MPKSVLNIIDISEGINSDSSAKLISDNSIADGYNVNTDRIGKIQSLAGFDETIAEVNITDYNSVYAFRTDNGGDTPTEYVLIKDGTLLKRYNAETLNQNGAVDTYDGQEIGINYSNGVLFIYSKNIEDSRIVLAENFDGSFHIFNELNYDTIKCNTRIELDGSLIDEVSFPHVTLDIENSVVRHPAIPATGDIDFTIASPPDGSFVVHYAGEEYNMSITTPSDLDDFVSKIVVAFIDHPTIPLSPWRVLGAPVITFRSSLNGNGNSQMTILFNDGLDGYFNTNLDGGKDEVLLGADNEGKIIPSGKYKFAASYVLWDGSETNLEDTSTEIEFDDIKVLTGTISINNTDLFPNGFAKGMKFYLRSENFEYSLLGEYKHDSNKRFKFHSEDEFKTDSLTSHSFDLVLPIKSTFRFESGYDVGELASPKMKKFLIVNNRGYALNVGYNDEWHQDRIIISPQGKPYLLPENNRIDIVTEDGDEYITAEHYGAFLFCFKKLTLFILNIGSNDPSSFYLSDSIVGVGVDDEAAVCKTEAGVFWANKSGIYYHNGEKLTNIALNKIEDEWKANPSDIIKCGYDPVSKKVIILRGLMNYVFDIFRGSFTKVRSMGAGTKSNFFIRDQKLSIIVNDDVKEFSTEPVDVNWEFITKDYDLGARAVRKKIRRFYVTFEEPDISLDTDFTLEYALDNTEDFTEVSGSFINNDDDDEKNTIAMFDLPRSITAYSVQLWILTHISTAIKDISIVYRNKLPK